MAGWKCCKHRLRSDGRWTTDAAIPRAALDTQTHFYPSTSIPVPAPSSSWVGTRISGCCWALLPCHPGGIRGLPSRGWTTLLFPLSWAHGVWNRWTGCLMPSTETSPGCWACRQMGRSWCGGRSEKGGWSWLKALPWWHSRSLVVLGWRRWVQQFKEGWSYKTTPNARAHVAELTSHMRRARKSPSWRDALTVAPHLLCHTGITPWKTDNRCGFAML